jgi:hypothetical protein
MSVEDCEWGHNDTVQDLFHYLELLFSDKSDDRDGIDVLLSHLRRCTDNCVQHCLQELDRHFNTNCVVQQELTMLFQGKTRILGKDSTRAAHHFKKASLLKNSVEMRMEIVQGNA